MIIDSPIISGSSAATGSLNQVGIVSITGSLFVNGISVTGNTGSAESASYAGAYTLTSSFQNYTSSTDARIASINNSTSSLNSYTSSTDAKIASINAFSASLLNYTSSTDAKLTALYAFSSSLLSYTSSNNANISSLNSYTSSATARFVGLETATASFSGRVGGLEASTASLNTYTSSNTANITSLNSYTSSATTRFVGLEAATASLNSYTSSATARFIGLEVATASLNSYTSSATARFIGLETATSSLNTFTSSANTRLGTLEAATSSLNSYTSSATNRFVGLEAATSSLNSYTSSNTANIVSLNSYTSSNTANITSLNSYTSSATARFVGLEAATSSLNTFTSSINSRVTVIESKYATTGSNTFVGTQTITGSLLQSGSFTSTGTITAQMLVVQTITSSVLYSSGSNIFGNNIGNTQVFTGSMLITGSNIIANVGNACFGGSICATTGATLGNIVSYSYGSIRGYVGDTDGDCNMQVRAECALTIKTGGNNTRMTITPSGCAGIGTSTPTSLLNIQSTSICTLMTITNCYPASGINDYCGTSGIIFQQFGNYLGTTIRNAGKILSIREDNYSTDPQADSSLVFYTATNNTDTARLTIDSLGSACFSTAVGVGGPASLPFNLTVWGCALMFRNCDFIFHQPNSYTNGIAWKNTGYVKDSAAIRPISTGAYAIQGLGFYTGNYGDNTSAPDLRFAISPGGASYFNCPVGINIGSPAAILDVRAHPVNSCLATLRIGTQCNGGDGDEFANLEFYWGDPDAAEVKAKIFTKNTGNVGPGGGGAASLIFATRTANAGLCNRFSIDSNGISNFCCTVCSPTLVAGSTFSILGNCSAYICFYKDYSGSPSNPGFVIVNASGTTTLSHNSNGGATNMGGNLLVSGVGCFACQVYIGTNRLCWTDTTFKTLQVGNGAFNNISNQTQIVNNIYYDDVAYRYLTAGTANRIIMTTGGDIQFEAACSGNPGCAITLYSRMFICGNSGNVGIGTTNPLNKFSVSNLINRAYTPNSFNDTSHALHIEFCDQNQRAGLIRWTSHGNLENSFGVVQVGCSTGSGCGQGDFVFQAYRTAGGNVYCELMRITNQGCVYFNGGGNIGMACTSPGVTLTIGGTDALRLPTGTTAQRPTTACSLLRFNSDLRMFDGAGADSWGPLGVAESIIMNNYDPYCTNPAALCIVNNNDGGGTTWEFTNSGMFGVVNSSGGHSGQWGPLVYMTPGAWRWRWTAIPTVCDGSIHPSTPAAAYKCTIYVGFNINGISTDIIYDTCVFFNNMHIGGVSTPTNISTAGCYTVSFTTNGYMGVRKIWFKELVLEKIR